MDKISRYEKFRFHSLHRTLMHRSLKKNAVHFAIASPDAPNLFFSKIICCVCSINVSINSSFFWKKISLSGRRRQFEKDFAAPYIKKVKIKDSF